MVSKNKTNQLNKAVLAKNKQILPVNVLNKYLDLLFFLIDDKNF